MTARIAPEGAGRMDHIHGDEHMPPDLTPTEQAQIDRRASELLADRLKDRAQFDDLLAGMEVAEINPHLHRALENLDNACSGDRVGIDAVLTALCHVQRTIYLEARKVWLSECEQEAEAELP